MVMRINGASGGAFSGRNPFDRERERKPESKEIRQFVLEDKVYRSEGPSEQVRAEVAGLNRAIQDTEKTLAIAACAMGWLESTAGALEELKTLAETRFGPAAHNGPGASEMAAPGQHTGNSPAGMLAGLLARIESAADTARFGELRLLDGALGCTGAAVGDGLFFLSASDETRSSPPQGYEVLLTHEPARATMLAEAPLNRERVGRGMRLMLAESGRRAWIVTTGGQTSGDVVKALRAAVREVGLPLLVESTSDGRLVVQHGHFGSAFGFSAASSEPGVLSGSDGRPLRVANGQDIAGTIHGEPAEGDGLTLTGRHGNTATSGLMIRYTGLPFTGENRWLPRSKPAILEPAVFAGRVIVAQQALKLRMPEPREGTAVLRLDSVRPRTLGLRVENESGFSSLAEIRLETPGQARDAAALIGHALHDLHGRMEGLRNLSSYRLPAMLAVWRVKVQNLHAAGPAISGDAGDVPPMELVRRLNAAFQHEGRGALSAQARPSRGSMLELLVAEPGDGTRLN
ncbi:MAG: hypothetical protein V3S64_07815 [bacterium]